MVSSKDIAKYPGIGVTTSYKKKKKRLLIERNNIHGELRIGRKKMIANNEFKHKLPARVRLVKQKNGKKVPMFPANRVGRILGLRFRYNPSTKRVIYTPIKAHITSIKNLKAKPFMYMSNKEFIRTIGPIARREYHRSGILASVTIAQAMHESFSGCSYLAQKGNNLFGMKAYLSGNTWKGSVWKGKVVKKKTKEQYGHKVVTITDKFRKYDNIIQNFRDHSAYFVNAKDGNHKRYPGINKTKSYKKQLKIMKKGGYCTFSNYTKALKRLIRKYNLTYYDR